MSQGSPVSSLNLRHISRNRLNIGVQVAGASCSRSANPSQARHRGRGRCHSHIPPGTRECLCRMSSTLCDHLYWSRRLSNRACCLGGRLETARVAVIIVEIPGTGDSPALPSDPTSPDRQWSSLLDWVDTQPRINNKKLIVWGFSTGGYYSIRLAHTHKDRIMAATALGGGCHHMFDAAWLDEVNHLEYPFE